MKIFLVVISGLVLMSAPWDQSQAGSTSVTGHILKDCADCPEMVVIPPGVFQMGSNDVRGHEKPIHEVRIPRSFAMGKTEVTQAQWQAVTGSNPSKYPKCGDNCPVDWVSWVDIQDFIRLLNAKTGKDYRLPSEAEWEYACRAGGKHTYCGSNELDAVAWYWTPSTRPGKPVASKQANAWGLFDMSGNVSEWVEDCWNDSYNGAPTDGSAWKSGDCKMHTLRGGSTFSMKSGMNAANRGRGSSDYRSSTGGFRLVRTLP